MPGAPPLRYPRPALSSVELNDMSVHPIEIGKYECTQPATVTRLSMRGLKALAGSVKVTGDYVGII